MEPMQTMTPKDLQTALGLLVDDTMEMQRRMRRADPGISPEGFLRDYATVRFAGARGGGHTLGTVRYILPRFNQVLYVTPSSSNIPEVKAMIDRAHFNTAPYTCIHWARINKKAMPGLDLIVVDPASYLVSNSIQLRKVYAAAEVAGMEKRDSLILLLG